MKDHLTLFTKYMLDFMFYAGIIVTLTLPLSISFYGKYNSYFARYKWELVLLFFLSGTYAVLIIRELRKIFRTVLDNNCFLFQNVHSLHRMGNYSFGIVLVTFVRLFLYLTPAVFVILLTFTIAGLFSKVLAQVFAQAVSYKEENDLTI